MINYLKNLIPLLVLVFTAFSSLPVKAIPIVFDFEDGMQGWQLHGSAQRVQTQLLGGEWAIFGDGLAEGGASISIEMDLTDIASISVEQFFIAEDEDALGIFKGVDLVENVFIGTFERFDVIEPGNPSLRAIDVSSMTGVLEVLISWGVAPVAEPPPAIVAFIDNITFYPIPEPSRIALVVLGLVGLALARRTLRVKEP